MTTGPDFLIIGLKKAGTYWLSALLDTHPDISCFPPLDHLSGVKEGDFFNMIAKVEFDKRDLAETLKKKHSGFFRDLAPLVDMLRRDEFLLRAKEMYDEFCGIWRTKKLVGEKTPTYVSYLGLIDSLYPGIKKICLIRDPKDRIASFYFYKKHRARLLSRSEPVFDDALVRRYVETFKEEYKKLLDYRGSLHCLTYNSLLNNPRESLADALSYLEVPISEGIIERMMRDGDFKKRKRFSGFLGIRVLKVRRMVKWFMKKISGPKTSAKTALRAANFWYRLEWRLFKTLWVLRLIGEEGRGGSDYFRKGGCGGWRNLLTKEQAAYVDRKLGALEQKVLRKYGLDSYV